MSVKLGQIPFVRILIPFIAGIILELNYASHFLFLYVAAASLLFMFWRNWRGNKNAISYPLRWVNGVLIFIFLLSAGYSITLLDNPSEDKLYIANKISKGKDSLLVSLVSVPQEKDKTFKAIGEVVAVIRNGHSIRSNGKVLLYFQKDSTSAKLNYGDELFACSKVQEVKPPSNPDEFDYRQYLQMRGINYECYVLSDSYIVSGDNNSNRLLRFANNSRKKLTALLQQKVGGNEAAVASAILLGYRDDLSPSVIQSFVNSGVVHVICVAGLHVGILFLLLSYIIVFPERIKYGKLMSVILILLLLWLYALFTGFATPVLRATIMFSFLTVGKYFRRYTNTINTLAASAFLMLLINPFSLSDAGFQLSYVAVLGIIIVYKPLLNLWNPDAFILKKVWELICVSVAAQIAVFPLSILYFHQFPNYFIISNILVVPLLSVVIFIGIVFFLISWIPFLSTIIAWLLKSTLLCINFIVSGISSLPYSTSGGISISVWEAFLLFLCMVLGIAFFFFQRKYLITSALLVVVVFLGFRTGEKIMHSRQQIITVYNIPGKTAVAFISGNYCLMPFNSIDSADIALHIQYNWWKLGVKHNRAIHSDTNATMLSGKLMVQKQFMQFNNIRVAFIRQNSDLPASSDKLNLHCIIVSKGYNLDMLSLKKYFNFDIIIFDSSVPDYKMKKWEAECKQLNLHYYDVKMQGAYIENC